MVYFALPAPLVVFVPVEVDKLVGNSAVAQIVPALEALACSCCWVRYFVEFVVPKWHYRP